MSAKLIDDSGLWFLESYSKATGVSQDLVEKMEVFLLVDVLKFNLMLSERDLV